MASPHTPKPILPYPTFAPLPQSMGRTVDSTAQDFIVGWSEGTWVTDVIVYLRIIDGADFWDGSAAHGIYGCSD